MNKPIALTCGDPSGIGPEITVKAWQKIKSEVAFYVLGDPAFYDKHSVPIHILSNPDQPLELEKLNVFPIGKAVDHTLGLAEPRNAQLVKDSISIAVDHVKSGLASAICTNPINKHILQQGCDFPFPGHTEFLAHLADKDRSVMMLAGPELRVVPVTIHIALEKVKEHLTETLLIDTIKITHDAMQRDFGIEAPRIAVAGLNPHAGENGTMGREEIDLIIPTLEHLRKQGLNISGPHPADTMFHASARKSYDVAVCMYHDQALIPIKTLDFDKGVNVTLGLPFVRTSPDHGTAFDIAGKGKAKPDSLVEALLLAQKLGKQNDS